MVVMAAPWRRCSCFSGLCLGAVLKDMKRSLLGRWRKGCNAHESCICSSLLVIRETLTDVTSDVGERHGVSGL
jgi:hypothetical protein